MNNSPTIVIVDDEPMMCQLLAQTLSNQGFTVLTAENGASVLTLVKDHSVALVVTDLNMPKFNGLMVIESLRTHGYVDLPVIVMTGGGDHAAEERLKLTANVLRKPFRRDELVSMINSLLKPQAK